MLMWHDLYALLRCVMCCVVCLQLNEGNVFLYELAPTDITLLGLTSNLSCTPTSALAVAATMTCSGTFTFDQAAFEAGTRNYTALLTSANYTGTAVSNMVSTRPVEAPGVTVAIKLSTCMTPNDAGDAESSAVQTSACAVDC